jgi:glycosyltransferase involved in cell wall biosynthesis
MDNTPKRTKILYVITKSNWGGAQRYVYDLATSLNPDLFTVEVIAGGNGLLIQKLQQAGIAVTSLHTMERDINFKKELLSAKELWKIFREKKPDVVHLNSSKAGGIGALVARLAGVKKIIFTAHAWAFNENRELFSKMMISFFHWITVLLSHKTITVSDSVREQISHKPFIQHKMQTVHLGIHPFELRSLEEARQVILERITHHTIVQDKWIGIIAELHPVKGLLYAVDAVALLQEHYPDLRLVIIGEGDQRDIIVKQIAKRRLQNNVFLVGFIDEARTLIRAFDIFMLPSLSEAFGYTLIEAGHAEVPVIASNVGGIPEVIDEAGILVPSKNSRELANAIQTLLSSKPTRNKLSKALHQRALSEFSVEKMMSQTLDIYNNKA